MLCLFILSVSAKFIETRVDLAVPVYLGRFSGHDVTVLASARVDTEASIEDPVMLQVWIFSKQVEFQCGREYSEKIAKIDLPVTDEWGEDLKENYDGSLQYFFYVSDCENRLSHRDPVIVQLDLQDEHLEHYPVEFAYEQYVLAGFLAVHILIIFIAIYGIYQETHDEIPLVFIFIISIVYVVSIMFQFLDFWIYGMDGTSFKLIMIFCKFFECFSRCSIFCILLLVTSASFDPKEFNITGSQFLSYVSILLYEFLIETLSIINNDVSELFESFAGWGVWCLLLGRISLYLLHNKKTQSNLQKGTILKTPLCLYLLTLLPLLNFSIYLLSPIKGKASTLYLIENLFPVFSQFYLLVLFMSTKLTGVLPTKSHDF
jgi:hypothetical protein